MLSTSREENRNSGFENGDLISVFDSLGTQQMFLRFFVTDQVPDIAGAALAGQVGNSLGLAYLRSYLNLPLRASRILQCQMQARLRSKRGEQVLNLPQIVAINLVAVNRQNLISRLHALGVGVTARSNLSDKATIPDDLVLQSVAVMIGVL